MRTGWLVLGGLCIAAAAAHADVITLNPSKDNTLYQDADGFVSNGIGNALYVGRSTNNQLKRGVLAFDIAGSIPAGSTITAVSLRMNVVRTSHSANATTGLHRLLADWGEGPSDAGFPGGGGSGSAPCDATWIHRFYPGDVSCPTAMWSTPGGQFNAVASATTPVGGLGAYTWTSAGLVTDVQSWLDTPANNFGWLVKGNESNTSAKAFDSRESSVFSNRPRLTVTFTPPVVNTGACCAGSACLVTLPGDCVGPNTQFIGQGSVCAPYSAIVPCCRADFNRSGTISSQDIFDFLAAFFSPAPNIQRQADFNDSGAVSSQDIFDFLAAFFRPGGCVT